MSMFYIPRSVSRSALLLALALLLAACGGTSPTAEDTTEATTPPEPTTAPTTEEAAAAPTEPPPTEPPPTEPPPTEPPPTEPPPTEPTNAEATTAPEPTEPPTATSAPPTATSVPPTPTPSGPVVLRSGMFNFVDNLHNGTGTAQIIQQPDGSHILRLDGEFSVTFGPDLFMWLAGHPEPKTGDEARNQGYVNLGGLQSRSGAQEYAIPADVNLDEYQSAVVWCRAFGQVMTSAPLGE